MRVVFMGKCKRSAAQSLDWLVERGAEVAAVVAEEPGELTVPAQRLDLVAERHGLPLVSEEELYAMVDELEDVDIVISFLFWNKIRRPLIELGRIGCLNFHPAPLPDIRGVGGYNVAVLEGMSEWGVSCHFVDEDFDTGDIVQVDRFPIDPEKATALSLDLASQRRLQALFEDVLARALAGEELPRSPQGDGRYFSREDFQRLRRVAPGDDLERKLRAFWYPPWPGAVTEVDGKEVTLVDEVLLSELAEVYRAAGRVP